MTIQRRGDIFDASFRGSPEAGASKIACGGSNRGGRPRQNNSNGAATNADPVADFDSSAVSFRDLTRENQADSAAVGFGRIKRSENVGWVQKSGTVVINDQCHIAGIGVPVDFNMLRVCGCS